MDEEFDLYDIEMFNITLAITRMSLASIHAAEGKLDAAIEEYTRVLEFDPNLYIAYYNRGRALWRKGERERAKEDMTRAINLEPGVAITYICRGDIFYDQGDLGSARKDYRKALELAPSNPTAMERIALLRKKKRGVSP
jgi:tetratricopeptide (TPR) repeat protein